jgi:hypothetical protein
VREVKEGRENGDCVFGNQAQSDAVQPLSELDISNSLRSGASPKQQIYHSEPRALVDLPAIEASAVIDLNALSYRKMNLSHLGICSTR